MLFLNMLSPCSHPQSVFYICDYSLHYLCDFLQCLSPGIPAAQKAEAGGSKVQGLCRVQSDLKPTLAM